MYESALSLPKCTNKNIMINAIKANIIKNRK